MKTNRERIVNLLTRYLKNSLSKEEEMEFLSWLNQNDQNKALLKEFKKTADVKRKLKAMAALDEDGAWDNLCQRLEDTMPGLAVPKRVHRSRLIAFFSAASVILLVAFSWLFFQESPEQTQNVVEETAGGTDRLPASSGAQLIFSDGESIALDAKAMTRQRNGAKLVHDGQEMQYTVETSSSKQQERQYHTLVVPKAAFFRMVLADGTKVWVNAMSKLHFPEAFSKKERRVFLEGEAYFEVAPEEGRPFFVDVEQGRSVKVLGTHFNVNTHNNRLYTTLEEGKVEVFAGSESSILMPGQMAYVGNDKIKVRNADLKRDLAWKNGEFYFKDDNIVQIAHQLSLWYDLDVRVGSSVSTTKTYAGLIRRDVNLSEVLELLSYATKLSFKVEDRKLTITESQTKQKT